MVFIYKIVENYFSENSLDKVKAFYEMEKFFNKKNFIFLE